MRWISVEDRLPEMDCDVMVWGLFGFDRLKTFGKARLSFLDGDYAVFSTDDKSVHNVTHWQPLPPPPQ